MIPQNFITEWKLNAPWGDFAQIEQDLILSRALVDLYSHPLFYKNLAFKGGTALQKLFMEEPARYSEDIDLVQIKAGPIGEIMDVIRKSLNPWLGKPKYIQNEYGVKFIYRYVAENEIPMRVKIEINTREQFSVFGFQDLNYEVQNPWYSGSATIRTFHIEELLGTKLKALYQRKKGRDLFDIDYFLTHHREVDWSKVTHCFQVYSEHEGVAFSRAELEKNLILKSLDPAFYGDIFPLLTSKVAGEYKPDKAFDHILEKVSPLLKGSGWKQHFGEGSPLTAFVIGLRSLNSLGVNEPQKNQAISTLKKLAIEILEDELLLQKSKDLSLQAVIRKYVA